MCVFIKEYISPNIFRQGCEFYNAAGLLKREDANGLPFFVCLAFSVELFLKSLKAEKRYKEKYEYPDGFIIYNDLYDLTLLKGGHNLSYLFNSLQDNVKDEIREEYNIKFHSNIDDDIEKIKTGFIDWRYMYERKVYMISKSCLINVSDFLFSYVNLKLNNNKC